MATLYVGFARMQILDGAFHTANLDASYFVGYYLASDENLSSRTALYNRRKYGLSLGQLKLTSGFGEFVQC